MSLSYEQEFDLCASIVQIQLFLEEIENLMAADLITAARGVSAGIDSIKKLGELALKTQNIELQEGILHLREQLLEVKETLLNAREEVVSLREENNDLKEKVKKLESGTIAEMTVKKGLYYTESGDGPFCTNCYDSKQLKIRVAELPSVMRTLGNYKCHTCDAVYT